MLDDIIDPFQIFNGYTFWVWEWINIFIPDFMIDEISYPCRDEIWTMLVQWAPDVSNNKKEKKNIVKHLECYMFALPVTVPSNDILTLKPQI